MKILAVDTGTKAGDIAILEDDNLIIEYTPPGEKTHAEKLLPSIDTVLKKSGITLKEIDVFAVTTGPGSFTGLRIGIATIKGFAWTFKKPVVGISTLKALAMNIRHNHTPICPILDARKEEVYTAIYKWENNTITTEKDDCVTRPSELFKCLNRQTIFLGDGITVHGDAIKEKLGDCAVLTEPALWHIQAVNIARLALKEAIKGFVQSPEILLPSYLKRSVAETKLFSPDALSKK